MNYRRDTPYLIEMCELARARSNTTEYEFKQMFFELCERYADDKESILALVSEEPDNNIRRLIDNLVRHLEICKRKHIPTKSRL